MFPKKKNKNITLQGFEPRPGISQPSSLPTAPIGHTWEATHAALKQMNTVDTVSGVQQACGCGVLHLCGWVRSRNKTIFANTYPIEILFWPSIRYRFQMMFYHKNKKVVVEKSDFSRSQTISSVQNFRFLSFSRIFSTETPHEIYTNRQRIFSSTKKCHYNPGFREKSDSKTSKNKVAEKRGETDFLSFFLLFSKFTKEG